MKALLIILLFPLSLYSQDTISVNAKQLDSLNTYVHQFTGVATQIPEGLLEYDAFQLYTLFTPKFYYHEYQNGKLLFTDEYRYFKKGDTIIYDHPKYSKIYSRDIEGKFYQKFYYGIDSLGYLSKTENINDTLVTYQVNYAKNGKLFSHGHYYNDLEHGNWPTYRYNDSILFTEVWTFGKLTDVKSERTIYLGKKNKVISKAAYFEIIKSQKGVEWNVYALPAEKLENPEKVAFIMYSERLDFSKFMDKKWEDFKFVDILLRRNQKYLKKLEKNGK